MIRSAVAPADRAAASDGDPFGWRSEGEATLRRNLICFRTLLARAQAALSARDLDAAAAYAETAALSAVTGHCGLFASAELEHLLRGIARLGLGPGPARERPRDEPAHVLHVATVVQQVGGLTQMIWRWIDQDPSRRHSVVLTRQTRKVPPRLLAAVEATGGEVIRLSDRPGSLLARARRLRALAATADIVVLHIGNRDVIPVLAFADPGSRPPVLLLDHADHLFWIGVGAADLVVALRQSGRDLALKRRGIPAERSCLLPILIEPVEPMRSRIQAKRDLGFAPGSLVLVSVARGVKYRTVNGVSFAATHLPFLVAHPEAVLVVVGAGRRPDWQPAIDATGGRIIPLEEQGDVGIFREAADIHVDSFPFVSTTSALEGGLLGVPVVSRFLYSEASAILGMDMPGLDGVLVSANSTEAYTAALARLARDEAYRHGLGNATRRSVLAAHSGEGWRSALSRLYDTALALPPGGIRPPDSDNPLAAEPDVHIPFVHGAPTDVDGLVLGQLGLFPPHRRPWLWAEVAARRGLGVADGRTLLRGLVPEWVVCGSAR